MAKLIEYIGRSTASTTGNTKWGNVGIGLTSTGNGTVQAADTISTVRNAGLYSNLYIRITSNAATADGTYTFRKGVADAAMNCPLVAGYVGAVIDNTNTDAIASGDQISTKAVSGTGGTTVYSIRGVAFAETAQTSCLMGTFNWELGSNNDVTNYNRWTAIGTRNVAEQTSFKFRMQVAGILHHWCMGILGPITRTTDTFYGPTIDGVAGSVVVTVPNGASGAVEDGGGSDTVVNGTLVGRYQTRQGGVASGCGGLGLVNFQTTNNMTVTIASAGTDKVYAASASAFEPLNGLIEAVATETDVQAPAGVACFINKAQAYISANTIAGTGTINLRKNAGNAVTSISVPAGYTGWASDGSGSDAILATDALCWQVNAGAGGTSMALVFISANLFLGASAYFRRSLTQRIGSRMAA